MNFILMLKYYMERTLIFSSPFLSLCTFTQVEIYIVEFRIPFINNTRTNFPEIIFSFVDFLKELYVIVLWTLLRIIIVADFNV